MKLKVYFLRHGEAGSRDEWRGDDAKRPLTGSGTKRMKREAARIWGLGLRADAIISSPLVRALQTAEIVARASESAMRVAKDARLAPGFGPRHLAAIVAKHRGAQGLMLVGHDPDFSRVIRQLTGGGRVEMKKGALACVQMAGRASLEGTLEWLLPPEVLEG